MVPFDIIRGCFNVMIYCCYFLIVNRFILSCGWLKILVMHGPPESLCHHTILLSPHIYHSEYDIESSEKD